MNIDGTLLNVSNMTCWYSRIAPVVSHSSFQLDRQSVMGILGGNGAGKTTLFMALADIIPGKECDGLDFLGQRVEFGSRTFKKNRFLAFADDKSFPTWKLDDYLAFLCESYGKEIPRVFSEALIDGFDFGGFRHTRFSELSSGNRKKASLIASFAIQTPILMLDEPTDFLDFDATEYLYMLIEERKEQGLSTVVSSHIAETFTRCCDYLYVLNDHRLSRRMPVPEDSKDVAELLRHARLGRT